MYWTIGTNYLICEIIEHHWRCMNLCFLLLILSTVQIQVILILFWPYLFTFQCNGHLRHHQVSCLSHDLPKARFAPEQGAILFIQFVTITRWSYLAHSNSLSSWAWQEPWPSLTPHKRVLLTCICAFHTYICVCMINLGIFWWPVASRHNLPSYMTKLIWKV